MEVYTADDVARIMGVSKAKAYNMIRHLNDLLKKKGTPEGAIAHGRVSKKLFHEKMGI